MSHRPSAVFAVAGCVLASLVEHARADVPVIDWHDERLTLHAHDADRSTVLRQVSRATKTPIDGLEHVTGKVSIDLADATLRSALQALIGNVGYALTEFGRADEGEQPHYAVLINGPRPPRPQGMPNPGPGQPGWNGDGPPASPVTPTASIAPGSLPLPPMLAGRLAPRPAASAALEPPWRPSAAGDDGCTDIGITGARPAVQRTRAIGRADAATMKALVRALLGTACAVVSVGASAGAATVQWQADRLSVRADRANRADLLREVARQTHTEIDGLAQVTGEVTLHVSAVPLDAALTMIADDGGYALVRRAVGGRLRYTLYIVERSTTGAMAARTGQVARPVGAPANVPAPSVPGPTNGMPPQGGVTVTEDGS